ncbi:heavy-metal-associated domain-containing protein [Flavobacterium sp. MAH-1]|uniref:Heavy-metal-associated domain-containing protein n=1 Tax=Flavobacterium agri TaxID=2743471 RepID=A0A7Y8Y3R6_9FLAO|nr:heavy-metal-associated domain-containing protein [Flavobacterium agri]NUY81761.1 heavy-metal-associated domain-containing protein [Flavobacterium agri]NYA71785.1 heavy-metal-associated domain-containing protein [Flavobacterium agri]
MKKIIFILLVALIGIGANAQQKKSKNAKYSVEVNGNCEQCKKRIEKAAFSVAGVKSAVWDVDSHQLALIINEEKTSLEEVEKAVAKAGHDSEKAKASDEDYDKLHSCCKYGRKP